MSRHTCNCDYCVSGREAKKDLQFGGTDWDRDDEVLVKYRKPRGRGKTCKKSKTNEPCNFTVAVLRLLWYSKYTERYHYYRIMTCERCGKHGQYTSLSTRELIN